MVYCINRHLDSFKNAYSLHPNARWKAPQKLVIMSKEQPLFKTKRWLGQMVSLKLFFSKSYLCKHLPVHLLKWPRVGSGPGLRERVGELMLLGPGWTMPSPLSEYENHLDACLGPTTERLDIECSKSSPDDSDVQSGLNTSMLDK